MAKQPNRLQTLNTQFVTLLDNNLTDTLVKAARLNLVELTTLALKRGAKVNDTQDSGETALCAAAHSGSLEVAKLLLEHNAEVDKTNMRGETALHAAAHSGSLEVAKLLLTKGADKDKKDKWGITPFLNAVKKRHTSTNQKTTESHLS